MGPRTWNGLAESAGFNGGRTDPLDYLAPTAHWNGGVPFDDSGLYWFWDSTWDDVYNNMNFGQL